MSCRRVDPAAKFIRSTTLFPGWIGREWVAERRAAGGDQRAQQNNALQSRNPSCLKLCLFNAVAQAVSIKRSMRALSAARQETTSVRSSEARSRHH